MKPPRPDLPDWVQNPVYIALHSTPPTPDRHTELHSSSYARVDVGSPVDWPSSSVKHRAYFTAPTGGEQVTHAAFMRPDGTTQWLDLRTDPPTPCDPPPGWVDLDTDDNGDEVIAPR